MSPFEREAIVQALRANTERCVERALARANSAVRPPSGAYASQSARAIEAAYDHLIEVVAAGNQAAATPVPIAVLAQARLAAASGLPLDGLLRRCMAVTSHVGVFVAEAGSQIQLSNEGRVDVAQTQVRVFERVIEAVVEEYGRAEIKTGSTTKATLKLVKGILEGEPFDTGALGYDLARHHTAVVAEGVRERLLKELAAVLPADVLVAHPGASVLWLWMATSEKLQASAIRSAVGEILPARCTVAFGGSERGESGWRESHLQAISAFAVARRTGVPAYYPEVMLAAAAVGDRVLESFLRRNFLNPIKAPPRGGDDLLQTLRAYFVADRNGSSAAAALEVSRQTVSNRLQVVEHRLGRNLSSCAPEVELALRLDELDRIDLYRCPARI